MKARKQFKAPWGLRLILVTCFSLLLFLGIPILGVFLIASEYNIGLLFIIIVPLGILIFSAFSAIILGYAVTNNTLLIRHPGWNFKIDLTGLKSVEIDPSAMKGTYVMSNGGFFSFGGGKCRNKKLGVFAAYATHLKRCVVLRFARDTLVVTPGNPEAFVNAIKQIQT